MVILVVVILIVGLFSIIFFYKAYDHSRKEQARIKQTLKQVNAEVSSLEQEQEKLDEQIRQLEQFLETSTDALIDKAEREIRDKNPSRLAILVKEWESTFLVQFADLAGRLFAPLHLKQLSELSESELVDAQKFSLICATAPNERSAASIEQFVEINNLCRERGQIGIYISSLEQV